MDHEGNVSPWLQLAEDRGLTVRFLPFDTTSWQVEADDLKKLLNERTRLVALNYASNLTGSINPVKQLVRLARRGRRADLCRRRAVRPARAGRRRGHRLRLPRLLVLQILRAAYGHSVGAARGDRCAAGLQMPLLVERAARALRNRHAADRADGRAVGGGRLFRGRGRGRGVAGSRRQKIAAAFAASIAYEAPLALKLIDGLSQIDGLTIHGITDPARIADRVPTVSFTIAGIKPETLVRQLNAENIFVWSGHNYAWEIVHQLGIPRGRGRGPHRRGALQHGSRDRRDGRGGAAAGRHAQAAAGIARQRRQLPIARRWRKKGSVVACRQEERPVAAHPPDRDR